ncbi:uncharacterized protein LOC126845266 isoform X2 [Adelges cooleyi]|uniref:uncharacterized protein LOC126845266 isoform X2 n=1 Tax=Adelges cooleyi TaxID=133065 RepID=UPI00217F5829|nr:uncharacterized protein LOC126845266 isoform X2 [Adelges cooleyi]
MYFVDSETANRVRVESRHQQKPLLPSIIHDLDALLRNINPYAQAFRNMREVWQNERREAAADPLRQPRAVTMQFVTDSTMDLRRNNAPAANEVAVVFVGDDDLPPDRVNFAVYDRDDNPRGYLSRTLPNNSMHADPMVYPLFFPYGERGWNYNTRQIGQRQNAIRTRITIRDFACYRLAVRYNGNNDQRHNKFSLIHAGRFLLQQYVCDQYIRMEANNLNYIRTHQSDLFAETYQGLMDHINQQHNLDNADVGQRVILRSTFTGCPRYMKQCYHDAMTVVRKYAGEIAHDTWAVWSSQLSKPLHGQRYVF